MYQSRISVKFSDMLSFDNGNFSFYFRNRFFLFSNFWFILFANVNICPLSPLRFERVSLTQSLCLVTQQVKRSNQIWMKLLENHKKSSIQSTSHIKS